MIFDTDALFHLAEKHHASYTQATPFPHIVLDDFITPDILQAAVDVFPTPDSLDFYKYDNPLESKLAFDRIDLLPEQIQLILRGLNGPTFLRFLEILTGTSGLISDPYYRGGGIHQITRGGKLDIHLDFNKYTKLGLFRRMNAILFLNQDWQESYGGHLEFWEGHQTTNGEHVLDRCAKRVLPIFNRLVIFNTTGTPYHGHPEPLTCPGDRTRKSIATYYYTAPTEDDINTQAHSTIYVKRPGDPDDSSVDELRKQRKKGRVASNVESSLTA